MAVGIQLLRDHKPQEPTSEPRAFRRTIAQAVNILAGCFHHKAGQAWTPSELIKETGLTAYLVKAGLKQLQINGAVTKTGATRAVRYVLRGKEANDASAA